LYKITQEQEIFRDTVKEFAQQEVIPLASKIDWDREIPSALLENLPSLGLYGVTVPSEFGGVGADFLSLVIVSEELSRASGSIGARVSLHNAVVCEALRLSSNTAKKEKLLPKLASGTLGAFSFSADSPLSCKIKGSEVIVDGSSNFVLNAEDAGIFVVLAKLGGAKPSDFALLAFDKADLSSNDGRFEVGEARKMLGMRASGAARISFDGLHLPLNSLLFDVSGTSSALSRLNVRARLAVAAQALGLAQASIDAEVKYANERVQFNTKIGRFYAVQDFIAQDEINLETSRAQVYLAASQIDSSETIMRESAVAKISASNCAVSSARHAIRVHGGYGFVRDYPVERYVRDARLTQIYPESNESLKAQIAGSLLGI